MNHFKLSFLAAILIVLPSLLFAQEIKKVSASSTAYAKFKAYKNKHGLISAKVQKLLKVQKAKDNNATDDDYENRGISQEDLNGLSASELYSYCMAYPESYSQICDVIPPIKDEDKKIMALLATNYDEYYLSTRQIEALKTNSDAIVKIVFTIVNKENRLGLNNKILLHAINAKKAIPNIIKFYKASTKKDYDVLTLLNLLMLDGKYEPFMSSASYKKLYAENETPSYDRHLTFNKDNEALILERAQAYYDSL
jgi:hypothetical protein